MLKSVEFVTEQLQGEPIHDENGNVWVNHKPGRKFARVHWENGKTSSWYELKKSAVNTLILEGRFSGKLERPPLDLD
ncbi:hypothetical protein H1164_08305 [Thermoactinomyces daqus]|uniref:Uncharacterized protein n=1 Tax=Thermoactinomyces daqus TaxID=1329516 RepID=A0A7W1XA89_9BACL|nr:hypothetical protein [Thermoactinomyces daqus]MBA4542902.1 hypothetical protein [Thermoactinomyces daqus]